MNFKKYINELKRLRKTDRSIHTLKVSNWTLIFCPETNDYYAMDDSEAIIKSLISCIHPTAYRIDPETGEVSSDRFVVKIFDGDKAANIKMAKNEVAALKDVNQLADLSFTNDGHPTIVMEWHAGKTICDTKDGNPNLSLLNPLSLKDRLAAIFQIANQFHELHAEKINKKPRIHIDVKGENLLIDAPEKGPVNAWVIDFGSSKVLDASGKAETGLKGVTLRTIPPETVSEKDLNRYVELDDITGSLTSESDIYSLGSVFAAILGASNPYVNRQGDISKKIGVDTVYDTTLLRAQITQGFDLTGLLSDSIKNLPYDMPMGTQPCAFRNYSSIEAPNDKAILEDETLPKLGYVLYKDQLLYVDKEKSKVSGRVINSKPRSFNPKVASIRGLKNTDELTPQDLAQCAAINDSHPRGKRPIDNFLRPLIIDFINQMVDSDQDERPSMEEVLRFFTAANKLAAMASVKDTTRTSAETELRIQIALLQLEIIKRKGWNIKLPLLLPDNTISAEETASFSQFDFDSLEENLELFDKLVGVFNAPNILKALKDKEPLPPDTFRFMTIHSEKKKLYDAILSKLQPTSESKRETKHDGQDNLNKKILELLSTSSKEPLLHVKKQGADRKKHYDLPVANKFLSLSRPMMLCLLEEEIPTHCANDFNLKKEFYEHRKFIKADFPEKYVAMKEFFTTKSLNSIGILLEKAPNITSFLSHDLSDALQVNELLKHQCQIKPNTPLTPESEAKLLALYQEMLLYKKHILNATSQKTFNKLSEVLSAPLLKKLQEYIDKLVALEAQGKTYQKFSLFGLFGHTVAEKRRAAIELKTAFKNGDYQTLLSKLQGDKTLNAALTSKTLGGLSQPLLSCMSMKTNFRLATR